MATDKSKDYNPNSGDDLIGFLEEVDNAINQVNPTTATDSDASNHQPQQNEEMAKEVQESDPQDWVESEKIDLPGQLALDVYETKDYLIVLCRVAGVDEKEMDVSISNNVLSIRGTLGMPITETVENHCVQECYWGQFSRSIELPVDVKKEDIKATLENGILKIAFTKLKQEAIKKIRIQTNL